MEAILGYWPLLLFLVNVFMVWITWSIRKGLVTQEALTQHLGKISDLHGEMHTRITRLEAHAHHSPGGKDLGQLHQRIDNLSSEVHTMSGRLVGVDSTLRMINEHMLKRGTDD